MLSCKPLFAFQAYFGGAEFKLAAGRAFWKRGICYEICIHHQAASELGRKACTLVLNMHGQQLHFHLLVLFLVALVLMTYCMQSLFAYMCRFEVLL